MKIAWLHSHFQYWTGGTKFIFEVVRRMNRISQTDIFVQTSDEKIKEMFIKEKIKFESIGRWSTYSPIFWLFLPFNVNRDARILRDMLNDKDAIVTSMFPMNIVVHGLNKKHFQYCFEPYTLFHDREYVSGFTLTRRAFATIMRLIYSKHDITSTQNALKLFTTVEGVNYWIKKVYNREAIPTYVGVDTDFFQRKENSPLRQCNKNKKIIICSTDYSYLKRADFVVDAMPEILKEVPNCKLMISHTKENKVGIRRLKKKIKNLNLEHNVELLGFISIEKLPLFYAAADVAVYAGVGSGANCNSLFVLEAMACETPVVRTDSTHDEVIHGESGFLFRENNKGEMVRCIVKILSNEEMAKKMGKAGRERVRKIYNWDRVANKILDEIKGFQK